MKRVREYAARWEALLLVFLIGTFVFGAGVSKYFWTASNISIATASFMPVAIVALAMTLIQGRSISLSDRSSGCVRPVWGYASKRVCRSAPPCP